MLRALKQTVGLNAKEMDVQSFGFAAAIQAFQDDKIDAGEIGSGHTVTALYELVLAQGEIPAVDGAPEIEDGENYDGEVEVAEGELALVKIRYKEPGASEEDQASQINTPLGDDAIEADFNAASWQLQWTSSIAAFAEILKESPYANSANLETITEIAEAHKGDDPDRVEFAELLNVSIELLNQKSNLDQTDEAAD